MIETVVKRNGQKENFDDSRIFQAILGAFTELDYIRPGSDNAQVLEDIADLTASVVDQLEEAEFDSVPVDVVQEYVFDVLIMSDYKDVAKAYIRYAERKNIERENLARLDHTDSKVITVEKKSGRREPYDRRKIVKAITMAAPDSDIPDGIINTIVEYISSAVRDKKLITTEELHNLVEEQLAKHLPTVHEQYAIYRRYKKQMSKSYDSARQESERILYDGDNENANRDSQLNSTKQTLTAEAFMKRLVKDFELPSAVAKAHEEGWIYIHDIGPRYLRQANCCLFDMSNVLKGGFTMNGVEYYEPKYITSALAVMGDVTLQASGQQFGGFTIPEIDTVLAPYVEKTYQHYIAKYTESFGEFVSPSVIETKAYEDTIRDLEQGVQGFETKLNTVSSSLGQTPFITISLGLSTSKWGREVAKAILKVRERGIGQQKITAVFPKIVFLARKDTNLDPDSPNYDIFQQAVSCSSKRLYPDYLSLDVGEDENNLGLVYERSGQVVSPMGCRAFLSPFYNKSDKEIYTGRGNLGAASLNLPKIAIESKGDMDKFYATIRDLSTLIWNYHEAYAQKVGKQKGSSNPLFYCEGGAWQKIGYSDSIADTIRAFTSSLGYVGINEAVVALTGDQAGIRAHQDLALEIVAYLKKMVDEVGNQVLRSTIPALYSTPAESLAFTFARMNKERYGHIKGVTDREYITNSFHIPVWEEVNALEKIHFEQPFHRIATGGRISYTEFPYGTPLEVLEEAIRFAMSKGLYYGVNIVSSSCGECLYTSDFRDECPKCGERENIRTISRVCGYLSIEKSYGEGQQQSRYNPGKRAEVLDRVKHV